MRGQAGSEADLRLTDEVETQGVQQSLLLPAETSIQATTTSVNYNTAAENASVFARTKRSYGLLATMPDGE